LTQSRTRWGLIFPFLIALAVQLLSAAGPVRAGSGRLEEIQARGALMVGLEIGYYPFEYLDEEGRPAGFDVDLAGLAAANLKVELKLRDLDWPELMPELRAGRLDCLISALAWTPQRAALVDFTRPYFETGLAALLNTAKTTGVDDPNQLNAPGRTIAVIKRTEAQLEAGRRFDLATVIQVDNETSGVQAVVSGRADAYISDQISIWKLYQDYPGSTRAILQPFTQNHFHIAVARGQTAFRDRLDRFLEAILESGQYDDLYQKYFRAMGRSFRK